MGAPWGPMGAHGGPMGPPWGSPYIPALLAAGWPVGPITLVDSTVLIFQIGFPLHFEKCRRMSAASPEVTPASGYKTFRSVIGHSQTGE